MNTKGENGTVQVSNEGVGSPGVALFNKLIRGAKSEELRPLLDAYISAVLDAEGERQEELFEDLFVLTFQTRDVLKGKGERDLFYELIFLLYKMFPNTVLGLLKFIPKFGYWKDVLRLIHFIDTRVEEGRYNLEEFLELKKALLDLYAYELKTAGEGEKKRITLSGKWAPREGSMYNDIATQLAERIYPEQSGTFRMRSYRKLVSGLTKVVEQLMSAKKFSEIDFAHIPSKAMQKYKAAFLKAPEGNEDRLKCSENMKKYLKDCSEGKATMNAKTLMPHELSREAIKYAQMMEWGTPENKEMAAKLSEVVNIQWEVIKKKFITDICQECDAKEEDVVDLLSHSIALSDVSGSMGGIPMDVSIGMGILISQFCKAFPNTMITFESVPQMYEIKGEKLTEKALEVSRMPWGGSTDFMAALRLLLKKAVETGIPAQNFPKIMFVFSDMQFDAAVGDGYSEKVNPELRQKYSTNHDILLNEFVQAGYEVPLIIYWNLRAGTPGHESSADVKGTVMLSGYNPTLLKSVFSGQDLSKIDFSEFSKKVDPQVVYDNVVTSPNYDCLREALKEMKPTWMEELLK